MTRTRVEGLPSFRCGRRRDKGITDDEVEDKKEGKQDEKVENICLVCRKVSDTGKRKEIIQKCQKNVAE